MEVDDKAKAKEGGSKEDYSEEMNDPAFLQSVLESLPGVDPQSEAVRSAVGAMAGQKKEEEDDKKKKEAEEKKKKDEGK